MENHFRCADLPHQGYLAASPLSSNVTRSGLALMTSDVIDASNVNHTHQ